VFVFLDMVTLEETITSRNVDNRLPKDAASFREKWRQLSRITVYGPLVTCTACLRPIGYMYRQFNIHKIYVLATYGSQNKPQLFPYAALTGLGFITKTECLLRGTDWTFTFRLTLFLSEGGAG